MGREMGDAQFRWNLSAEACGVCCVSIMLEKGVPEVKWSPLPGAITAQGQSGVPLAGSCFLPGLHGATKHPCQSEPAPDASADSP